METQFATTPFGRRPAALAQIAAQIKLRDAMSAARAPGSNAPAAVNKWHVFRTLTEIRERLGLSDRALSVLNALLSFHPETALTLGEEDSAAVDLVVYPSNRQLSLRAHGMAEVTIRRHLAALVQAELIVRRDSPNGKRYARRDADAGTSVAFGFDLAPLVLRAMEFDSLADAMRRERRERQFIKERISLRRRDIQKWLAMALDEDLPGDWEPMRQRFMRLLAPLRGVRTASELADLDGTLGALHTEIGKALEMLNFAESLRGNDARSERHISNSNTDAPIDFEPAPEGAGSDVEGMSGARSSGIDGIGDVSLGLALEACPDLKEWAEGVGIADWKRFIATAERVRPMLGVSPDAWVKAKATLGERQAAVALGFILQRSEHSSEAVATPGGGWIVNGSPAVRSAGGYLRSLTEEGAAGALHLGSLLMALIGQRVKQRKKGG